METSRTPRAITPWIRAVRTAPERLPLSPEWEARALELRQDWSRVSSQIEALEQALGPGSAVVAGLAWRWGVGSWTVSRVADGADAGREA